jgi:two-component system OmpR family response regulator/two-component system phosphate regulon response regulator OmpR
MRTNQPTQILVVDDDPELRDLLREYLTSQGFAVSVLHDGDGLQARLERERPALIVLDLMMPKVDGLTALRNLRAKNDDIPVILLTARSDEIDRIVGLEIGADDYLGKPFSPRELLARINAVLRRKLARPAAAPEDRESWCSARSGELPPALARTQRPVRFHQRHRIRAAQAAAVASA